LDIDSLIFALLLVAALGLGYWYLRRRSDAGDSAPQHFFGAADEETVMHDTRTHSPSELPSPRPPGQHPR
jgi:hypothetical protein